MLFTAKLINWACSILVEGNLLRMVSISDLMSLELSYAAMSTFSSMATSIRVVVSSDKSLSSDSRPCMAGSSRRARLGVEVDTKSLAPVCDYDNWPARFCAFCRSVEWSGTVLFIANCITPMVDPSSCVSW